MGKRKKGRGRDGRGVATTSSSTATPTSASAKKKKEARATATTGAATTASGGDARLRIPAEVEVELLALVKARVALGARGADGTAAPRAVRLTRGRLRGVYDALTELGFGEGEVEEVMQACLGGDVAACLDWLCLNLDHDSLPTRFTNQVYEQPGVSIAFVRNAAHSDPRDGAGLSGEATDAAVPPGNSVADDGGDGPSSATAMAGADAPVRQLPAKQAASSDAGAAQAASQPSDDAAMKAWVLQYMARSESEDEAEDDYADLRAMRGEDLQLDVNAEIAKLQLEVARLKALAAEAKEKKDKAVQKQTGSSISRAMTRLRELKRSEKYSAEAVQAKTSELEAAAAVLAEQEEATATAAAAAAPTPDPTAAEETGAGSGGEDAVGLDMFENDDPGDADGTEATASQHQASPECPLVEVSFRGWTGVQPKELLAEQVRKEFGSGERPRYSQTKNGSGNFVCAVAIGRGSKARQFPGEYQARTKLEAQSVSAVTTLYKLCPDKPFHRRLPACLADLWTGWLAAEEDAAAAEQRAQDAPREAFLTLLETQLQSLTARAATREDTCPEPEATPESWEDHAPTHGKQRRDQRPSSLQRQRADFEARRQTPAYQAMLKARAELPAHKFRDQILQAISGHQVCLVAGETGCGKTTQVPQFLLEHYLREASSDLQIVVTEPRRISAVSVARRVCDELAEGAPGSRGSLCGYHVRLESRQTADTRLVYCTTGILLRRLQSDAELEGITHIVVDEVHERSVQSDFLLVLLQDLLARRPNLKLVLMSATADTEKISGYFGGCPVVSVPGRTFPVSVLHLEDVVQRTSYLLEEDSFYAKRMSSQQHHERMAVTGRGGQARTVAVSWDDEPQSGDTGDLDPELYDRATRQTLARMDEDKINYDLIEELILMLDVDPEYAAIEGAVLVFMPGFAEIHKLFGQLNANRQFYEGGKFQVIPLHSTLSNDEQQAAFLPLKPGVRKIVIATNIAETGITIPDAVFVVDTGRVKESRYRESNRMSCLVDTFVSRASATQRQGRAGRVRPGVCFRLFTHKRFKGMPGFTTPEIQRTPLESLCLHILATSESPPDEVLRRAMDPPSDRAIQNALQTLDEVGALVTAADTGRLGLTALGRHLVVLPVDVHIAKMVLFGSMLGCQNAILVIAAALSFKSPFLSPFHKRKEAELAQARFKAGDSDLLAVLKAYEEWKSKRPSARKEFCRKHYISDSTMFNLEHVSRDLRGMLSSIGFAVADPKRPQDDCFNREATEHSVIKAAIVAGLYPHVARIDPPATLGAIPPPAVLKGGATARPHPGSALHHERCKAGTAAAWVVFNERVKTSKVYLRGCSRASPASLLLFSGPITVQHQEGSVLMDGWIRVRASAKTAVIFRELRHDLSRLLQAKIEAPGDHSALASPLLAAVVRLLKAE